MKKLKRYIIENFDAKTMKIYSSDNLQTQILKTSISPYHQNDVLGKNPSIKSIIEYYVFYILNDTVLLPKYLNDIEGLLEIYSNLDELRALKNFEKFDPREMKLWEPLEIKFKPNTIEFRCYGRKLREPRLIDEFITQMILRKKFEPLKEYYLSLYEDPNFSFYLYKVRKQHYDIFEYYLHSFKHIKFYLIENARKQK
jgi:hypothetical protein